MSSSTEAFSWVIKRTWHIWYDMPHLIRFYLLSFSLIVRLTLMLIIKSVQKHIHYQLYIWLGVSGNESVGRFFLSTQQCSNWKQINQSYVVEFVFGAVIKWLVIFLRFYGRYPTNSLSFQRENIQYNYYVFISR